MSGEVQRWNVDDRLAMSEGVRSTPAARSNQEAFDEQATEAVMEQALRYARQRAVLVQKAGQRVDGLYARELVLDALGDTWMGEVAWDPARCPLLDHVRGVIRWRSWKEALGARRTPHLSLSGGDAVLALQEEAVEAHASQGSISPIALAALTAAVVAELRRLAAGDADATAVLAAWAGCRAGRREVMAWTGLSETAYRSARKRLAYLVLSLPQSLREAAQTMLRRAS